MVGVFMEEYSHEWPQVGKITSIDETTISLHWYTGTITSKWTAINKGRTKEPFMQTIRKSAIITNPFRLTGTSKLPQDIQRFLREKQEELY